MYGWEWRYPGCEESVYAFPEVIIGAKVRIWYYSL